jgi:hypothetical protein
MKQYRERSTFSLSHTRRAENGIKCLVFASANFRNCIERLILGGLDTTGRWPRNFSMIKKMHQQNKKMGHAASLKRKA